ncbi:MAG TPA: PQQ-binding-like beta-propeller repeat protein [Nocardioidaceae bacterium]
MSRCVRVACCLLLVAAMSSLAAAGEASDRAASHVGIVVPAGGDWKQFAGRAVHHNHAVAEGAFTQQTVGRLHEAWRTTFGTSASSTGGAAVAAGQAFIGGADGVLSAFSLQACATGSCTPLWRGVTKNGIHGTPAIVTDGLVLVGSADHFLYAFHTDGCGRRTCPPVWRGKLQDSALASVAVFRGRAYIGDAGGHVYAFHAHGCGHPVCQPLWTGIAGPNLQFNTIPAVADGHVFIGAFFNTPDDASGRLFSFATLGCGKATCRPEWRADMRGQVDGTLSPLVLGDTVFMGSGTRFSNVPNGPVHLFAFDVAGCGKRFCHPVRSYRTGDADLTGGLAVANGVIYAGSQSTPDPNTIGVFMAFPADGCGAAVCDPLWTAVNFASGFESPPVVSGDVVFVAKGPASGFPVDQAVLSYPADGCGQPTCTWLSFTSLGDQQFYLGSPIAVARHTVFVPTEASADGTDDLVALTVE